MRHVGEAKTAIAIGLDRRTSGEMRLADDDAFGHRLRSPAPCPATAGFSRPPSLALPGRSRNRISSGAAMKIDE